MAVLGLKIPSHHQLLLMLLVRMIMSQASIQPYYYNQLGHYGRQPIWFPDNPAGSGTFQNGRNERREAPVTTHGGNYNQGAFHDTSIESGRAWQSNQFGRGSSGIQKSNVIAENGRFITGNGRQDAPIVVSVNTPRIREADSNGSFEIISQDIIYLGSTMSESLEQSDLQRLSDGGSRKNRSAPRVQPQQIVFDHKNQQHLLSRLRNIQNKPKEIPRFDIDAERGVAHSSDDDTHENQEELQSAGSEKITRGSSGASEKSAVNDTKAEDSSIYEFGYRVIDNAASNNFGHRESHEDGITMGEYHVLLPNGQMQRVKYRVDHRGFQADVSYTNQEKIHTSSDLV